MMTLKKIGCRAYQLAFRAMLPILPYREPKIISSCERLGKILRKNRISSVLVVTDAGIVKNRLVEPLEASLMSANVRYVIYDKTQPNPTVDNVEEALEIYYNNGCTALVAIGGGSSIDCAKAIGARAAYPQKSLQQLGGKLKVWRRIPTLVAIPTTAGTGSEVTLAALITDTAKYKKYALMSFPLIPHCAVLDPSLTYSLPPHLTASTGMDALTHAVEAYIGRSTTSKTRALALEATKMIFENIEKAYHDGSDRTARENMLNASYKAGIAFSMSYVGYVHAIAHSIGGRYGTPHGLANAVILPHVLEKYGKSAEKKLYELAVAAGVCDESVSYEHGAKCFINAIKEMNKRMNIPSTLSELSANDITKLAIRAEREANPLYPVPMLMTAKELEDIYYDILDLKK